MPSVYDSEAFAQRVNYAVACIVKMRIHTRHFDTCFEMSDGDAVAVAVYRRSLKNPGLAANIWRALARDSVTRAAEELKDVPTRKLPEVARRQREASAAAFREWLAAQKAGEQQSALIEPTAPTLF